MRELSFEERINLLNVLRSRTYTGRPQDGIMSTVESFRRHVLPHQRTLELHHKELDELLVPRYTNNPYHTGELLASANEVGNPLRLAMVSSSGKFNTIGNYTNDWLLEQALTGTLKRQAKNDIYYILTQGEEEIIIRPHCGVIRSMVSNEYYAYLVNHEGE